VRSPASTWPTGDLLVEGGEGLRAKAVWLSPCTSTRVRDGARWNSRATPARPRGDVGERSARCHSGQVAVGATGRTAPSPWLTFAVLAGSTTRVRRVGKPPEKARITWRQLIASGRVAQHDRDQRCGGGQGPWRWGGSLKMRSPGFPQANLGRSDGSNRQVSSESASREAIAKGRAQASPSGHSRSRPGV